SSSPFPLKNPKEWRIEEGDRRHPPQLGSPLPFAESIFSVDRVVAVFPELCTVAGPSSSPLLLSRLSRASFKLR
ncbi:Os05g0172800, partial [Oryza sativa Japonica Group]